MLIIWLCLILQIWIVASCLVLAWNICTQHVKDEKWEENTKSDWYDENWNQERHVRVRNVYVEKLKLNNKLELLLSNQAYVEWGKMIWRDSIILMHTFIRHLK